MSIVEDERKTSTERFALILDRDGLILKTLGQRLAILSTDDEVVKVLARIQDHLRVAAMYVRSIDGWLDYATASGLPVAEARDNMFPELTFSTPGSDPEPEPSEVQQPPTREEDIGRIVLAMRDAGHVLTPERAEALWREYSKSRGLEWRGLPPKSGRLRIEEPDRSDEMLVELLRPYMEAREIPIKP